MVSQQLERVFTFSGAKQIQVASCLLHLMILRSLGCPILSNPQVIETTFGDSISLPTRGPICRNLAINQLQEGVSVLSRWKDKFLFLEATTLQVIFGFVLHLINWLVKLAVFAQDILTTSGLLMYPCQPPCGLFCRLMAANPRPGLAPA
jgi:hypothetical protein